MPQNELVTLTVTLLRNGDLTIEDDDKKPLKIAHYNRISGHLEFETKEWSVKLYQQVVSQIGTINKGKDPSGLVIRSMGVKGDKKVDRTKMPKRPPMGPKGDAAADYVQWMLDYDLPQAIIRYGIYTDDKGQIIKKHCRRLLIETVDLRATTDNEDLPWMDMKGKGKKNQERTPVFREGDITDVPLGIVARRATDLTFTAQEVVGGYQPDEDFSEVAPQMRDEEESET